MTWKTILIVLVVVGAGAGYYFGYDVGFEEAVEIDSQDQAEEKIDHTEKEDKNGEDLVRNSDCSCTAKPICSGANWEIGTNREERDQELMQAIEYCKQYIDLGDCADDPRCLSSCSVKPCPLGIPSGGP